MIATLLLRGIDLAHFHRKRLYWSRPGAVEIRSFGLGVILTAAVWMSFPVAFFDALNTSGRAYTAIVLCGMTGGSATVLAASKVLSALFSFFLVVPTAVLFLLSPGQGNKFFGVLGLLFFVVMYASSRLTHHATITMIELARSNEALLLEMEHERRRTIEANRELRTAQAELSEMNSFLELRIQQRTAQLEEEILKKERYAKELAHLASSDPLTGLSNRTTLETNLAAALHSARETEEPLAVLFLDLDKFKQINDVMGHLTGDKVLNRLACRLLAALPAGAQLARWGGDEFVAVVARASVTDAAIQLANRLSSRVREPIELGSNTTHVDVTIGIALFPEHGQTPQELIRAADMAMYACKKENGRFKVRLFDMSLSRRSAERHLMEQALREAITNEQLEVVFQPILGTGSGRCEAFEALARWQHPERGAISPSDFIPLAEQSGQIWALGQAILNSACRSAATWECSDGFAPAVCVNVSAAQLESDRLVSLVATALEQAALSPSRLQLELTESVFAGDHRNIVPALAELRKMGVRISLDDFGTGYSCFADLRRLPIDRIKIDKSFVDSIHADTGAIVRAIVTTADTFGLEVIAEGVETAAQAQILTDLRVQYLQGFFFSGLLSAETVPEWLSS